MALEQRGFTFSEDASAFTHQSQLSSHGSPINSRPLSPKGTHHSNGSSGHNSNGSQDERSPPSTPPASSVFELQSRTFTRLQKKNITPTVDRSIRLLTCAGRKEETPEGLSKLKDDLFQCLISTCPTTSTTPTSTSEPLDDIAPNNSTRFLSLTLTDTDPISLFIESRFVSPSESHDPPTSTLFNLSKSLLGSREPDDVLVPIILDLRDLPLEATGIVCGVAGRLADDTGFASDEGVGRRGKGDGPDGGEDHGNQPVEISFLSTARAGTVLVRDRDLDRAVRALERGFRGEHGEP